jgi:hypothetical protein
LKYKQDGVLDKNKMMDNVQKHNICTSLSCLVKRLKYNSDCGDEMLEEIMREVRRDKFTDRGLVEKVATKAAVR